MNFPFSISENDLFGLLRMFLPSIFKTGKGGKGRPRKVSMAEKLANGADVSKLGLSLLSGLVLMDRKVISQEHLVALLAYVTEHLKDVDLIHCFPSSPKWVVRSFMLEMGFDEEHIPPIAWNDIMGKFTELYSLYMQKQSIQQAWADAQKQGWKPEQFNDWIKNLWQTVQQEKPL